MNSLIDLTKELISKPSYDDGKFFESPTVDYVFKLMKEQFPFLKIQTQDVAKNRRNIFATDGKPCKLFVVNQIDTVQPSSSWTRNPFEPAEEDGKIYGLGSTDSKGNVAAFLSALAETGETNGLSILWYVDEEYHFAGMKHYVESDLAKTINPNYILSIDGNGLSLGTGCRGLLEFELKMRTTSEHSAIVSRQTLFEAFSIIIDALHKTANKAKNTVLGIPPINIAKLEMGTRNEKDEFINIGNRTPEELTALIEIRTTPELTLEAIQEALNTKIDESITLSYDLKAPYQGFASNKEDLIPFIDNMNKKCYLDPKQFGYLDLSMLQAVYPNAVLCSYGAGTPGQAHAPDESVLISDLVTAKEYHKKILQNLCQ